ncbi:MAG: DNA methyltransferase [Sphingobium sp.]
MNAGEPVIRKRPRPEGAVGASPALRNLPVEQVRPEQDYVPVDALKLPRRQVRRHNKKQIDLIADNLKTFGQIKPIVIDAQGVIVAGVAVYEALRALGVAEVQVVRVEHLSPEMLELYAIADNKLAELSSFDPEVLVDIFKDFEDLDFDLGLTGLEPFEIDNIFAETAGEEVDEPEDIPDAPAVPVSSLGDMYRLGDHLLLCGNALERESYVALMGDERATMIVTDSPYDVKIRGNVSGLGKVKHDDFIMGSGELGRDGFIAFLKTSFTHMVEYSIDGSIHFACMDWRHVYEMMVAGEACYSQLKNILVWNKGSGAMGSFYRSQHEFIFSWKKGEEPHINNFGLGGNGRRTRTNVITMPGASSFSRTRQEDLAAHSTVKPTRLFADLILDVSRRGDIVLDPFCGSGTTLLAAERTGRKARCIELDPKYVDVAIERWQSATGRQAIHVQSGLTFEAFAQAATSQHEGEAP